MFGSDSTYILRYAGWSAYLSAILSILATVFLFLFYGVEVPRAIAAGGEGTHVFGTLNDITGLFQLLFLLPLTVALYRLSSARRPGLSVAAMALGIAGLLTAVIAQALLVAQVISFAVNLPVVLAALLLIGAWLILANHLGRSAGALSARLAWLGEATGVAFVLAGCLAPVVVLAGPNGPLSAAAASFGTFAQQHPVIVAGGIIVAIPIFLFWSFGMLIWSVWLGRRLLAVAAAARGYDKSLSNQGVFLG
jgi:hypothetical protein